MGTENDLWIRSYDSWPTGDVRLFMFPHAGGSASYYFPMGCLFPARATVFGVQYPGRQERRLEPLIEDVPAFTDALFDALLERLDRPFAFFGHSLGATLAFELARRVEREKGLVAAGLFVSARRSPTRYRHETVHLRGDDAVVAEVERLNGGASELLRNHELREMAMPAIRADYRAAETYRYEPAEPLRCPITAFVGDTDPKVTVEEAAAWSEVTSGEFTMNVLPGGHFYLDEHRAAVVGAIAAALDIRGEEGRAEP